MAAELLSAEIETPIGPVVIAAAAGKLVALEFADVRERLTAELDRRFGAFRLVPARDPFGFGKRLRAYFRGELAAIDGIPVDAGGTPFQRRVWEALRRIPAGTTTTYAALAGLAGRPAAIRAAGAANGRNPVSIVVPCHRVIGSDGTLTGYGGGIERKAWLLRHESAAVPRP